MLQRRFLPNLILGGLVLLTFAGCSKKDEDPAKPDPTTPVLTTSAITNITQTTAACGGTITSDGGATVSSRGIQWSPTAGFEKTYMAADPGTGTGTFSVQATELTPDKLYYIRAYATNSKGTSYGNAISFTTLKIPVDSLADIDGNIYHVVPVGEQSWLRENLRVKRYRNGDAISQVTLDSQWKILTTGAYCSYDNLPENATTYGNIYNWYALNDTRGLCPSGWHVPSDTEWEKLGNFLGGLDVAGGLLKSTGTIEQGSGLWYAPNTNATNSSEFSGLPGGYRINYGTFYSLGNVAYFWSSSDTASVNGWNYVLDANNGELQRNFNLKPNGFSVRCCKN